MNELVVQFVSAELCPQKKGCNSAAKANIYTLRAVYR